MNNSRVLTELINTAWVQIHFFHLVPVQFWTSYSASLCVFVFPCVKQESLQCFIHLILMQIKWYLQRIEITWKMVVLYIHAWNNKLKANVLLRKKKFDMAFLSHVAFHCWL